MADQPASSFTALQSLILGRLAELAVPADDFPSAADTGAVGFIERMLAVDRPDWRPRVMRAIEIAGPEPALDAVLADSDGTWLIHLLAQGFYAGELHLPDAY
ncbi:MAG TPA: hypothetical protein VFG33_28250, partial [Kribbella sp.]|nr:hypothetical protein [Kribbella sp.]